MLRAADEAGLCTWQRNVRSPSLRLNVGCVRPRGFTVSPHRSGACKATQVTKGETEGHLGA